MTVARELKIWWNTVLVGALTQTKSGDLRFRYDDRWLAQNDAPPLSWSLPKRAEAFSRAECRPFFGGLLPEAAQREAVAQHHGVSPSNEFALLERLGGDVAGALSLLTPGSLPEAPTGVAGQKLSTQELFELLKTMPARPLLVDQAGLRLSLAGAQAKAPVVLVDEVIALPQRGQPTTHILKPAIPGYAASTENEAFIMRLASRVGLDVATVEPRVVRRRPFLLIERYDREITQAGHLRRIHQEDFCQALGVPPERKYSSEGGPTLKQCFELVRRSAAQPARDVLKLLDAVIFNVIVGNADAHGKNFSLLVTHTGRRLAPLYDLLSTVVYPSLKNQFAMKVGDASTLDQLTPDSWVAFSHSAGLSPALVRKKIDILSGLTEAASNQVAAQLGAVAGLDAAAINAFSQGVQRRARLCRASMKAKTRQTGA